MWAAWENVCSAPPKNRALRWEGYWSCSRELQRKRDTGIHGVHTCKSTVKNSRTAVKEWSSKPRNHNTCETQEGVQVREVFAGAGCADASCRQNSNGATWLSVPGQKPCTDHPVPPAPEQHRELARTSRTVSLVLLATTSDPGQTSWVHIMLHAGMTEQVQTSEQDLQEQQE